MEKRLSIFFSLKVQECFTCMDASTLYLGTLRVSGDLRGRKRSPDSLELELRINVSCLANHGPVQEQQVL